MPPRGRSVDKTTEPGPSNEYTALRRVASGGDDDEKLDKKDNSKTMTATGFFKSRQFKLVFCFLGLQVSYILWGIVQEQLMTKEYQMGRFKSSSFCVFGNRFFALFVALTIVLYKRTTSPKPLKEAPYHYYAPSSISNSVSSWAQYEALKFISFPTQVLSKSCKLIPVMLVGIIVNGKSYPLIEYLEAFAITAGVAMFTFSEKHDASNGARVDTFYGVLLLLLYLCCDAFTSQWQSRVFKTFGVDQYQM